MRVIDVDPDVDGLDALGNVVENAKNSKYSPILLSFYGKWNDSRRQCVDSVEAEAVLDTAIKMQDTGVLIKVAVKDNKHWEEHESVRMLNCKIKIIPTLVNHSTGWRLEGEQCCNELLVKRMLGIKIVIQPKPRTGSPSGLWFAEWLHDFEKKISTLNNDEKKMVSFTLHSMCAPFKSRELENALDKLSKRDFLALLPPEVLFMILNYLDYTSLGCSAVVSHRWHYVVSTNDKLWIKALKSIKIHEPLMQKKLALMSPYKLFCNYQRKVHYFRKMGAELHCPFMEELNHSEELGNLKELKASADGHIVIGYTMNQPHNIYHKYKVSNLSSTKILASVKTIRSMDCRVNDNFLFCSSNTGRWVCYSWKTTREVYSFQTYDYGYDEHRFPAFAEPCDKCPILAVFDTNRIQFNPDGVNHTTIKFLSPFVNEHSMLEFGIRLARFKLDATEELKIITQQAITSSGIKFHYGHERSEYMPCAKHKVIFQQQNHKIFIYEVDTGHRNGPCSILFPVLLHILNPTVELDALVEPLDAVRYRLSRDRTILGYTSGPHFIWKTLDGKWNRDTTVEGNYVLTTMMVGNMFSLLAVVTSQYYRPLLVETGSGKIVRFFPALMPIQGSEPRRYSFFAACSNLDWLDDVPDSPELNCKTLAIASGAYREGFGVWHLIP